MLLEAVGIVKKFGGLMALNKASMSVNEGEIFGLIGPNGAGKTTLLNVIAGVYKPNEGVLRFDKQDISGWSPDMVCRVGIARTFQVPKKFQKMSVLENVIVASTFGLIKHTKTPKALAEEALDFVKFPLAFDTIAGRLNSGQLKRLDMARALASQPRLLLLDEPASGLNPSEVGELLVLIREINKTGVTVILVEHLMKLIMNVTGRMVVLDYGEKIAEGSPDEIVHNKRVIEAYLGDEYTKEAETAN